jgi:hypothetical protein
VNFAYEVSHFISVRFLICRKILRHGTDDFTSPPKEVVLRNFIALKNSSSSAGFETANLGFSDKHANQGGRLPVNSYYTIVCILR